MAARIIGDCPPFGLAQILPLAAFPAGKKRIRIRPDEFTKVFVKTETGIRGFYPKEMNGVWVPGFEFGENKAIL